MQKNYLYDNTSSNDYFDKVDFVQNDNDSINVKQKAAKYYV